MPGLVVVTAGADGVAAGVPDNVDDVPLILDSASAVIVDGERGKHDDDDGDDKDNVAAVVAAAAEAVAAAVAT